MFNQTTTTLLPADTWKAELTKSFVGKRLDEVRTPTLVIDRSILERNCNKLRVLDDLNIKVRVHTIEATAMQLEGANTNAIIVSTLAEARAMAHSELVAKKKIKQILLGFPITPDKFDEVLTLSRTVDAFQIFVDQLEALDALEAYCANTSKNSETEFKFRVFLKIDCGYHRAGSPLESSDNIQLAKRLASSPHVVLEGIYSHAGHSYASSSPEEGQRYLKLECDMARAFRDLLESHGVPIHCLSIGATPTVQAILHAQDAASILEGIHEVHCGAYTMLDRQQMATGMCDASDVAITVACRVASVYTDRVLLDGGALAFSKDTAPQGGFGLVRETGDVLTQISQEHGIVRNASPAYRIGQVVRVLPNHCCLTAACHQYYLIVDNGGDEIVDVWVPVRGW
ncbi:hypothetical protein DFQ28_011279 [Apophysomyces sp. BC1034]|nr:hypothetical protein DFQ30_010910 [Apophysomyces sp. BC1015]KAG0181239.1 hypothetical protein DFQ29_008942 [Apophysomyces sp. BC1021]KAG0191679.1 hypothetical protein DFQ28_011279 [Apophysomyces sp. BC1034]